MSARATLVCVLVLLNGCAANRPDQRAGDGPPAPPTSAPADHYANKFSRWFWTHDGPAIAVGTALVVGIIIAHKHNVSGHAPPPACGPGTGETCQPGPPVSVCTGATYGIGVCPWWQ